MAQVVLNEDQQRMAQSLQRPDVFQPNYWEPVPLPYDNEYINPAWAAYATNSDGFMPHGNPNNEFTDVFKQQLKPTDPQTGQLISYDPQTGRYGLSDAPTQAGGGFIDNLKKAHAHVRDNKWISKSLRAASLFKPEFAKWADAAEKVGYGDPYDRIKRHPFDEAKQTGMMGGMLPTNPIAQPKFKTMPVRQVAKGKRKQKGGIIDPLPGQKRIRGAVY